MTEELLRYQDYSVFEGSHMHAMALWYDIDTVNIPYKKYGRKRE